MEVPLVGATDHYVILEPGRAEWMADPTETEVAPGQRVQQWYAV